MHYQSHYQRKFRQYNCNQKNVRDKLDTETPCSVRTCRRRRLQNSSPVYRARVEQKRSFESNPDSGLIQHQAPQLSSSYKQHAQQTWNRGGCYKWQKNTCDKQGAVRADTGSHSACLCLRKICEDNEHTSHNTYFSHVPPTFHNPTHLHVTTRTHVTCT